ncbi:MAG: hypothetical protein FWG37_00790 [Clostridia bacterium]|nr:hypothetical protein [Clostridia bacterium]
MKKTNLLWSLLLVGLLCISMLSFASAEEIDVDAPTVDESEAPVVVEQDPVVPEKKVEVKEVTVDYEDVKAPEEKPMFTLTFLTDDDEILFSEKLKLGDRIVAPFFIPTKDGFVFEFWYDVATIEDSDSIVEYRFGEAIAANTVLKPFYSEIPEIEENDDDEEAPAGGKILLPWDDNELKVKGSRETSDDPTDGWDGDEYDDGNGLVIILIDDPEYDDENDDDEDDEELVLTDDIVPTEQTTLSINIFSTHSACMNEGSTIDLWAELVGFDAIDAALQWQYFDGAWFDAEGATELTHSFTANMETVNYGWRLIATVIDSDGEVA